MSRYILTTGGTGGHIFPALAVAEALKETSPEAEILFIGAEYGLERELARKASLKFTGLDVRGVLGRGAAAPVAMLNLMRAIPRALKIIRDFRPDCVLGFGNYASFAPVAASRMCKIPVVLHEQNAIPGSVNKLCGLFASKICVSLPHTRGFNDRKCVLTGNPVRKSIRQAATVRKERSGSKNLLVLGGSLGAHALNVYICRILPLLLQNGIEIIHQTGQKDWSETQAVYERHNYKTENVKPFISDMAAAYAWADLILCRAGASTVAEICATGLPAIFVPFPAAIHDHQTKNARLLEERGGAMLAPESRIDSATDWIIKLSADKEGRERMSENLRKLSVPDASANVLKVVKDVLKNSSTAAHAVKE